MSCSRRLAGTGAPGGLTTAALLVPRSRTGFSSRAPASMHGKFLLRGCREPESGSDYLMIAAGAVQTALPGKSRSDVRLQNSGQSLEDMQ